MALITILAGVAALAGVSVYLVQISNQCGTFPYPSIAGQNLAEHYHEQLSIFINDNQVNLPANIGEGDTGACPQPLHVHVNGPNTNVVHVESPSLANYMLGDFFKVWAASPNVNGQKPVVFSENQIFNYTVAKGYAIMMFVNGQKSSAFGNQVLIDRMMIVIAYGRIDATQWQMYQSLSGKPWPYTDL